MVRRLSRILFLIVCFIGFIYQVVYINNQYFSFQTNTRVESHLQDIVSYPTIIFCAKISDITGQSWQQLKNYTIEQLLDATPPENQTLDGCEFRDDSKERYIFSYHDSEECYIHFGVKKYITADFVCFQIYARKSLNYSINRVANAMSYVLYVFSIDLTEQFTKAKDIFLPSFYSPLKETQLSGKRHFPTYSRKFSDVVTLVDDDNWIIMRPYAEDYQLLPPPFDTNCSNAFARGDCFRHCTIGSTLKQLNLFPFSEPADEAYGNFKVLSSVSLFDNSTRKTWEHVKEKCKAKCPLSQCTMTVTSNLAYVYKYWEPVNVTLTVTVPGMYFKTIIAVPSLTFIEYVSSLSTCLSIWFGFSILSFNPLNWMSPLKDRFQPRLTSFKHSKSIYFILCLTGFLYQFGSICDQYFRFGTGSRIEVSNSDNYAYQSMDICFYLTDIINRTENEKYGLYPTADEAWENWKDEESILTVNQIYMLTPKTEDIIKECSLRDEFDYGLTTYYPEKCNQFFSIRKALRGEVMCYMFKPPENERFSWTKVASSFSGQAEVYSLMLEYNDKWDIVVTQTSDAFHGTGGLSRNFAQLVNLFSSNVIIVTSTLNTWKSLPPPYDTRCVEGISQDHCNIQCLAKLLKVNINRLPYGLFITNQSEEMKTVNIKDVENSSVSMLLWEAEESCKTQCTYTPCTQIVSFTDTSDFYSSDHDAHMRIVSSVPEAPTLHVASVPVTSITDFLLYICNCFGIWFGLSFVTCNPLTLLQNVSHYRQHITQTLQTTSNPRTGMKQKPLHLLMLVISVVGFTYQCYVFSNFYLTYSTGSRIEIAAVDVHRIPNLIFCTPFSVVNQLLADNSSHSFRKNTIREILEMSPNPNQTLVNCGYRFDDIDEFQMVSNAKCGQIWTPVKYVSGADICYDYISHPFATYSLNDVSSALSHVGIIYELYINESLLLAPQLNAFSDTHPLGLDVLSREILPIRSRKFGESLLRFSGDELLNYFLVQGTVYNVTLLQAPYDTNCLPDNRADFCETDCKTAFMRDQLQRLPFNEIITEKLDLRILSKDDLVNQTVRDLIKHGNDICSNMCVRPPCDSYYTLTRASGYFKPEIRNDTFVLAAAGPKSNGFIIKTFPGMHFMDLMNNLAASASIWFGVSVFSLLIFPVNHLLFGHKEKKVAYLKRRIHRKQRMESLHYEFKITPRSYCRCSYCLQYLKF